MVKDSKYSIKERINILFSNKLSILYKIFIFVLLSTTLLITCILFIVGLFEIINHIINLNIIKFIGTCLVETYSLWYGIPTTIILSIIAIFIVNIVYAFIIKDDYINNIKNKGSYKLEAWTLIVTIYIQLTINCFVQQSILGGFDGEYISAWAVIGMVMLILPFTIYLCMLSDKYNTYEE